MPNSREALPSEERMYLAAVRNRDLHLFQKTLVKFPNVLWTKLSTKLKPDELTWTEDVISQIDPLCS